MLASRARALSLLLAAFIVGGLAGAAIDRAWLTRVARNSSPADSARRQAERRGSGTVENDRIPTPLEALGLTNAERERLRDIALRWRPRTIPTRVGRTDEGKTRGRCQADHSHACGENSDFQTT